MPAAVVKLATLRELIDAKSVRTVSIVGGKGGWAVSVRVGQAERVLAGKDGAPRRFARLDTAARQLLDLGLVSFEVHGAYKAFPIDLKTPNATTRKAMTELAAGQGKRFDRAQALFKDLGI